MSAAAPNPKELMILAAVGIGVYWFMKRRQAAAATPPAQAVSNPYTGSNAQALGSLIGTVARLFNGGTTPGTYDGRAATPWSPASSGGNNPSAYLASSAIDGIAANIPNTAVYDAAAYGFDGSNGAYWN